MNFTSHLLIQNESSQCFFFQPLILSLSANSCFLKKWVMNWEIFLDKIISVKNPARSHSSHLFASKKGEKKNTTKTRAKKSSRGPQSSVSGTCTRHKAYRKQTWRISCRLEYSIYTCTRIWFFMTCIVTYSDIVISHVNIRVECFFDKMYFHGLMSWSHLPVNPPTRSLIQWHRATFLVTEIQLTTDLRLLRDPRNIVCGGKSQPWSFKTIWAVQR